MRVSLGWLAEYVDVDVELETLVERLDVSGTKVESVDRPEGRISGVAVGEVLAIEEHPNADTLTLVDVRVDRDTTQRVVCGARNFAVGDRVPLASVGARLHDMEIGARKIRGITSEGMLCSPAELGLSKDHSGIMVLGPDAPLGADVAEVLGLDDTIIEFEITTNRPDCLAVIGIAREVAAVLGNELRLPPDDLVGSDGVAMPISVNIQDEVGCPRYLARYIEGVRVSRSPTWLATRLLRAGVRPISNVVDATNYVMLETGQPLHAFDSAHIQDGTIVVRRAGDQEMLITLDGVERRLHRDDLLIADPARPLAIAGVMGGGDSEVSDATESVVLESAHFRPGSIAFTARRHLLRTEASARFERGTDPNGVGYAARRAARLIGDLSGGKAAAEEEDFYPVPREPLTLRLRPDRAPALLGFELGVLEQAERLRSIGLAVSGDSDLIVEVPTFRPDLQREVDLIEEVGRLAGLHRVPSTLPPGRAGGLDPDQLAERRVRLALAGFGLREVWTPSFGSPEELDLLVLPGNAAPRRMVALDNPTSEQETAMRTTLLPGLLRSVERNLKRGAEGAALFEVARVYEPVGEQLPREPLVLGGVFSGRRSPAGWNRPDASWDFFSVKGVLESLFDALRAPPPSFEGIEEMPWHPTRAASVATGTERTGSLGELHPNVCDNFDVPQRTLAFELRLGPVFSSLESREHVTELSRLPAVLIDLAVVVEEGVPARWVEELISAGGAPEVVSVRLFDLYRGEQVGAGKKSLAYALELRSPERTLTSEEAMDVRDRITDMLRREVGAELRA